MSDLNTECVPRQTQAWGRNRTGYQDAQGQSQTQSKGDLSLSRGGEAWKCTFLF